MRKNFFYRLNNFLILAVIVFVGILFFSKFNRAESQANNGSNPVGAISTPAYIINREVEIDINPDQFTAYFKSDGVTDSASDAQKAKFTNGGLSLIDIPIEYNYDKANSNLILPGEIVYPAIPKGTAPANYRCRPLDANGQTTEENRRNCLFGVTLTSVFSDLQTSVVTIGDRQFKVQTTNTDFFSSLKTSLDLLLDGLRNTIVTAVGLPDQSRDTVGTIRYWGDDDFQQFVKIDGGQGQRSVLVLKGGSKTTGVNQSEGSFASEFSSALNSTISTRYKKANVVEASLEQIGGPGEIFDPFSSYGAAAPPQGTSFIEFSRALIQVVTQDNQKFAKKQERLGAQVSLRAVKEAEEYSAKFQLCDAFAAEPSKYPYAQRPYKNPIDRVEDGKDIFGRTKYKCSYDDENGERKDDPGCDMYETYEDVSELKKGCVSGIQQHATEKVARGCALALAGGARDCDEFTVEETGLNLGQMEDAFPIGLGAYFQNATLANLDPRDTTGPYLNYLSPYFCAKLNLSFDLKGGKPYMYNVGVETEGVQAGVIAGTDIWGNYKFERTDVLNQYCVLGGIISNFAWAATQQQNNFGTNVSSTVINIPKEALTCDKKETAIFGATPVKSNIDGASNQPYYIMDDNARGNGSGGPKEGLQDEVALYQGYNAYPLTEIYKDDVVKNAFIERYADLDLHVVTDPATQKPKYVVISAVTVKNNLALVLCKLPSDKSSYSRSEKSLCKLIDQGGFVFPEGVGMLTQSVQDPSGKSYLVDTISVVYRSPGASTEGKTAEEIAKEGNETADGPFVYRYIDVVDQGDINKSFVSSSFELPYKTTVDVIQTTGGGMAVGGINLDDEAVRSISVHTLDPRLRPNNVAFDNAGPDGTSTKITAIQRNKNDVQVTGNLCTDTGNNYCVILQNITFFNKVKITQDAGSGTIYLIAISGGFGVVYPVDPTGAIKNGAPSVFGYNTGIANFTDQYDAISAMRINAGGTFDIFLERSGGYLNLIPQDKMISSAARNELRTKCGTNCWLVVQKHFDPSVYNTDCSDYGGAGACGYPKLNELGNPIVHNFTYSGSGKILAWYRHGGLDKTLLQSPDYLYSFTGLYKNIQGDAGPSNEFSNAYYPKNTEIGGENVSTILGTPIRYLNYSSGGFIVGRELENRSGKIREAANLNPEKLECERLYSANISGLDLYFGDTGLERPSINPGGSASSPLPPVSKPTDPNTGSSNNSGEYCEEKWCVPDDVGFVGNAQFGGDKTNENLKNRIASYVNRPRSYVDRICNVASESNVSCAVVAAIWKTESGAKTTESPRDPAFGCFINETSFCKTGAGKGTEYCNNWYTFDNQVKCAVNSLVNRAAEYQPGKVLTGPSDRAYGPYLTNVNRGGGACIPATQFSYVFQRYTPIDSRINNDNQCNKGLVIREGQDQWCNAGTITPNSASRAGAEESARLGVEPGTVVRPDVWPAATQTRIGLQRAMIAMDDRLRADNTLCFPKSTGGDPDDSSGNGNIGSVLRQYDTSSTTQKGRFKLNLAGWAQDAGAGYIYMALNEDWNNDNTDKDLQRAFIVPPGQTWSFNNQLNNFAKITDPSSGTINISQLETKYSSVKAPWNSGGFNFGTATPQKNGWSELATAIRMAGDGVVGTGGKRLNNQKFNSPAELTPQPPKSYGTGAGWKGDINHWQRNGVTLDTYNSQLLDPNDRIPLTDVSKYVEVFTKLRDNGGFNDADVELKNPYESGSGIDMIITIQLNEVGMVTIETLFGKKLPAGGGGTNSCAPRSLVTLDVNAFVPIRRDSTGKIVAGPALVDTAAQAYNTAREEVRAATGVDILGSVDDVLRPYNQGTGGNINASNKSWHKTGRAVDLLVSRYSGKICGQGGANKQSGCREAETIGGSKYWRIFQNGRDVTSILESNGFERIPDQCAAKGGDKCEEWWHYEFNEASISWEQAMLQIWPKEDLKSYFTDVNWDAVSCEADQRAGPR